MNYIYDFSKQADSFYIHISVDKQISNSYVSRLGTLRERASEKECKLMDSISNTKGVLKSYKDYSNPSELIALDGNRVVVKTSEIDPKKIPYVVSGIVKKIQRSVQSNFRKRIKIEEFYKQVDKLNK